MLALVARPSLHGNYACLVYQVQGGTPGEIAGKNMVRPLFLLYWFFCLVRILGKGFWGHLGIEVLNVGGWLTHGDLALDAGVDFLAVAEHKLIPARVRSEWARLKSKEFGHLPSQDSSHVGNAGVGSC